MKRRNTNKQKCGDKAKFNSKELEIKQAEFREKDNVLSQIYERVNSYDYYRDMFPENSFEIPHDLTCRPNGIINVINDKEQRGRSYARMIFDDLQEIENNLNKETVVISPVGYSGKRKRSKLAYQIFGMIIDLDDVGVHQLNNLLFQMENGILPFATYLINSGTGIHIVYLFETPIPAMAQYYDSLNALKAELSDLIWNKYTSREDKKQFQGIFQSFRVVGSPTKLGPDYRVSAYRTKVAKALCSSRKAFRLCSLSRRVSIKVCCSAIYASACESCHSSCLHRSLASSLACCRMASV